MMSGTVGSPIHRPVTRAARHGAIEDALATHVVTSQQQLAQILADQGFDVTQATLSRDLDELHAAKTRMPDGTMAYAVPTDAAPRTRNPSQAATSASASGAAGRDEQIMARALSGLVTSIATACNLLVVHTPSGAAQYVASVLDRNPLKAMLGTIAGDDTVLVIVQDEAQAAATSSHLLALVSGAPATDDGEQGSTDEGHAGRTRGVGHARHFGTIDTDNQGSEQS